MAVTRATDQSDLVGRCVAAAAAAIRAERPAFSRGPGMVRGVTVEVALTRDGQVTEVTAFVERRLSVGELAARTKREEGP